jgi:hypothetical protein
MPARLRVRGRHTRGAEDSENESAGRFHGRDTATEKGNAARGLAVASGAAGRLQSEHLLALQQTAGNRAVQRLVSASHGHPLSVQRRLSWNNPDQWNSAKLLDASTGGGGGVLFVGETDLREVVVKPGEDMAAEGAMAGLLHSEVGAEGRFGITMAPGFRVSTPQESQDIKAALTPLLPSVGANATDEGAKKFKQDRAQELVKKLDEPGVVVQDVASGREFKDVVKQVRQHTEKRLFGVRKLAKDSPIRIFKDRRSIQALGMTTAVDLFTGNRDRLFQFNAENFMVTPYSITMIDNIWMGTEMSFFQTREIEGRSGNNITITADEGLTKWRGDAEVNLLAQGDYRPISKTVFDVIVDKAKGGSFGAKGTTRAEKQQAKKASDELAKVLRTYEPRFLKYFSDGLAAGKRQLLTSLDSIITDPSRLKKLAPGVELGSIISTMKVRRDFLRGNGI